MPKVYRVVDSYNTGIYFSGLLLPFPGNEQLEKNYYNGNHPIPEKDSAEFRRLYASNFSMIYHKFGFSSIEQFLNWFSSKKDRETLSKKGVVLREYYVPLSCVFIGKHQVFFEEERSMLLKEMDISKL